MTNVSVLRIICKNYRFEFFFLSAGNEKLLNIYESMRTIRIYINENYTGRGYQIPLWQWTPIMAPNFHLLVFAEFQPETSPCGPFPQWLVLVYLLIGIVKMTVCDFWDEVVEGIVTSALLPWATQLACSQHFFTNI